MVPRGRRPLRARRGRRLPARHRDDGRDRRVRRRPRRARLRLRGRRRRVLPRRRAGPTTGGCRDSGRTRSRSRSRIRSKEDPRDFALWKATKPGEDTLVGFAVGAWPAGLAHRVLGDGRAAARAVVRHPRRRDRPRLPAPRERARAVARARPRVRAHLDAQRDAALHRREDVEVARQRRDDPGGARPLGPRDAARLLPHRALAQAARLLGGDAGGGGRASRALREVFRNPSEPAPAGSWERFAAALDDDFNTPEALAIMH